MRSPHKRVMFKLGDVMISEDQIPGRVFLWFDFESLFEYEGIDLKHASRKFRNGEGTNVISINPNHPWKII